MVGCSDTSLAIALGANLPHAGKEPRQTLLEVRPLLIALATEWADAPLRFSWSPLFDTTPMGGPPSQPRYLNSVVVIRGCLGQPAQTAAINLLDNLHSLERQFGRQRVAEQLWGPRTLDLDLLFWGELRFEHMRLTLPHPRLHLRSFVLEPLLAAMKCSEDWGTA
ncbi:2-amino-4-hydroxy-6-hydroxymethyldihydropteridine diphosphokinase [Synechococcus sp. M16CYN]|uniref:2-amino-4-hydroxy-6- hydroxymethyldihydropteridine diphosphokinase n=1 Tax=Synechococcus sp. M16CYN TaxID=3103139 RepID=UPI00324901CA